MMQAIVPGTSGGERDDLVQRVVWGFYGVFWFLPLGRVRPHER